ncbi:hypothetical protein Rmar_1430 [Rhodothermus marinus DSM 4252]|uniref:PIN domain-containing protein n=1 Tax=Rhodothermus marinus (strain ATCC 43812 / DSM 4252 / R-10) TaxID=518766 RepID=D0MIK9_RHOM4|nr:hypothetical protein Rmar_1430 [Rhodothermus marinus DSM 4252]
MVDTSVLVRYLTGTPEEMAARAAAILDGDEVLGVSLLVLAETAYVLLSVYGVPRRQVIDESLIWLLQKENLQPIGWAKSQVLQALMRCLPSGRVSIADAL